MLKRLSEELTSAARSTCLGFNEMLDEVRRDELISFVRSVGYGEHVLLLYRTAALRNRMVAGFFDSAAVHESRGAIMGGAAIPASVNAMTYEQLADRYGVQSITEKAGEWALSLQKGGAHLRLATDNTWLAEKGMQEADPRPDRSSPWRGAAVLCAYDVERIGGYMSKASESHVFIVLEDSNSVYEESRQSQA